MRVNYTIQNWCDRCSKGIPKRDGQDLCPECHTKLRKKSRHPNATKRYRERQKRRESKTQE